MSADEFGDERFLLDCFNGVSAVVGSDPGDGILGSISTHDGQASQGGSGPSMATGTTQLHAISASSTLEEFSESGGHRPGILRHAEVRPFEMIVAPGWFPLRTQIEAVIRWPLSGVGVPGVERHRGDPGAVGQDDYGKMLMHGELLMIVVRISAPGWFIVGVPVDFALRACHHRADLGHPFILM